MVIVEAKVIAVNETNPSHQFQHPAPAPSQAPPAVDQLAQLKAVLSRFEVSIVEANELVCLEDYEIVIIADDSGSMGASSLPANMRQLGCPTRTRWEEMKESIALIVELAVCFDKSGVDVHFLNRPAIKNVKCAAEQGFLQAFHQGPGGSTPLTETLTRVSASLAQERKVLYMIFTDGEPNGGTQAFAACVRRVVAGGKAKIQVLACTAEDDEIEWLNVLDKQLAEMDCTDDYTTERAQILKLGLAPRFTKGDWVMKAMLGPIMHKFDKWDEAAGKHAAPGARPGAAKGQSGDAACCSIS